MYSNLSKKFINWLRTNWLDLFFSSVILIITVFIAFKNYTPNTYLTGWDNLHPEFNFKLNIERSLNAVWQEYQGVGLLGGMSHAADLPRQFILAGLAVFIPISLIRYFWTFLMLFIGPLGVYALLKKKSKIGGLTASIFYIFNLATVQYFFVPFETFIGFFGFLPWLLYFAIDYLDTGKKLWKYALISILATSAFYVQTLFIVYAIFLFILSFKNIKRAFKLLLVTFLVNAFWLLPVLWFGLTSNSIPSNSDINKIASPETVLMNQARSSFTNITTMKGYWFDYYDFGKDNKFDYLFKDWIDYTSKPYVKEIGIGLFAVSAVGLILSRQIIWLILLGVGYLMLSGFKIPVVVLEEAFRNSFTKWSVAFSFVMSIGLGYFVSTFKKLAIIPAVIIACISIYTVWPIIDGKLISERVKISIPIAYFETFDWFNLKSDGGRIAYFPAFDKWGWNYHDWGYGGSGFIWYGIKNPILDRAFNVWSPNNENYYNEVSRAILARDNEAFKNIINKYQVKYLFFDGSVVFPAGDKELLKLETTRQFAKELGYEKVFTKDFIDVHQTNIVTNNFVSVAVYPEIDTSLIKTIDGRQLSTENAIKETFEVSRGYPKVNNCELMKLGSVEKSHPAGVINYKAFDGGVACDYFVFEDIKYDQTYALHIKGKNIKGRSLKVYLYNWESKRVELEELLPTGSFDSYFVVYPKAYGLEHTANSGYTLNIETRSFGRITSENIIEKIEFIPFEINKSQTYSPNIKNNLQIISVQKFGTAIYRVKTTGEGILELGQGYEKGWISYPKLEHIKVNSWANGWIINANSLQSTDDSQAVDSGPSTVVILFWPQFMEWFGFVVLCIVGIGLVFGFGESREVHY